MNSIINSLEGYTGILTILLMAVVIILLLVVFNLSMGLSRLNKKYKAFMKGKDAQSLEKMFVRKLAEVDNLAEINALNDMEMKRLQKSIEKTLSKYGIVKYDAFEDMGGKLSFALAMVDNNNTGFILNAIHSRENCFLYIKEIVKGESYIMLSKEEVEALKRAVNFNLMDGFE